MLLCDHNIFIVYSRDVRKFEGRWCAIPNLFNAGPPSLVDFRTANGLSDRLQHVRHGRERESRQERISRGKILEKKLLQ